jgi:hypothetical protein
VVPSFKWLYVWLVGSMSAGAGPEAGSTVRTLSGPLSKPCCFGRSHVWYFRLSSSLEYWAEESCAGEHTGVRLGGQAISERQRGCIFFDLVHVWQGFRPRNVLTFSQSFVFWVPNSNARL